MRNCVQMHKQTLLQPYKLPHRNLPRNRFSSNRRSKHTLNHSSHPDNRQQQDTQKQTPLDQGRERPLRMLPN